MGKVIVRTDNSNFKIIQTVSIETPLTLVELVQKRDDMEKTIQDLKKHYTLNLAEYEKSLVELNGFIASVTSGDIKSEAESEVLSPG